MSERQPSSSFQSEISATEIKSGWLYSLNHQDWKEYNLTQSWKYADLISGEYELKNEFQTDQILKEPALVLGLIPEAHRVYLNGQFIGGSNHLSDLAIYTFDSGLIKKRPEKNVIMIKAETRPNLNPGLLVLSDVPPQLAEFNEVKALSSHYYFKFYILKNIYFVFSFIVFLLSLSYAIYLKNKNEIFYSSLFLLLGCLHYSYYNPLVSSVFSYQFLRFIKLSCIVLSSLVLYSGYLATREKKSLNKWNNALALIVGCFFFLALNYYHFENSVQFVSFYNSALICGLIYVVAATTSSFFNELTQKQKLSKTGSSREAYFFLTFSFLNLSLFLGSFKNGTFEILFSSQARAALNDFGISLSFIFAICRIWLAIYEFTVQKRLNILSKKKDDFFIEISQIISSSDKTIVKINHIQNLCQNFLLAQQSTIYLLDPNQSSQVRLFSTLNHSNLAEKTKSSLDSVFGYVLKNKTPLLIDNINDDFRFQEKSKLNSKNFKTGSCMIFPLVLENDVFGILTFSDKENFEKFNAQDLEIGLKVSSFVSLLITYDEKKAKAI